MWHQLEGQWYHFGFMWWYHESESDITLELSDVISKFQGDITLE